jgi:hypothetical protein
MHATLKYRIGSELWPTGSEIPNHFIRAPRHNKIIPYPIEIL